MSLIEEYISYYPRKSEKTKEDRRTALKIFKNYMDKPLDEVTRPEVQEWVKHLEDKGLKGSTVSQYLSIVKNFYSFLPTELEEPVTMEETKEVLKKRNEYKEIRDVEGPKSRGKEERAFEPDEIEKLVKNADRRVHAKIFTLLPYFGYRRDELRKLKKEHIDFDERIVNIIEDNTKTDAGIRSVPFHPWIGELLKESKGEYVIGGKKPYSQSFFHWSRYYDVVDYHFRTHTFRYTFKTNMRPIVEEKLGTGVGGYVFKKISGHKVKGQDMDDHYMGEKEKFREDRRKLMEDWHFFNHSELFERLDKHF